MDDNQVQAGHNVDTISVCLYICRVAVRSMEFLQTSAGRAIPQPASKESESGLMCELLQQVNHQQQQRLQQQQSISCTSFRRE